MFTSAVIKGDHVIKSGGIERDSRAAAGEGKSTVMEDSICVRILVARHSWPIVAFEGREMDPALTGTREIVGESQ